MDQEQERRARAMRLKMNQSDLWRWVLRGIVIDAIDCELNMLEKQRDKENGSY